MQSKSVAWPEAASSSALTAKLNKLTINVDRPQLSPEDIKKLEAGMPPAAAAK